MDTLNLLPTQTALTYHLWPMIYIVSIHIMTYFLTLTIFSWLMVYIVFFQTMHALKLFPTHTAFTFSRPMVCNKLGKLSWLGGCQNIPKFHMETFQNIGGGRANFLILLNKNYFLQCQIMCIRPPIFIFFLTVPNNAGSVTRFFTVPYNAYPVTVAVPNNATQFFIGRMKPTPPNKMNTTKPFIFGINNQQSYLNLCFHAQGRQRCKQLQSERKRSPHSCNTKLISTVSKPL